MKKRWIIVAVVVILITCITLGVIFLTPKKTTNKLENDIATISVSYLNNKGYEYKEIENETKIAEISKKEGDFIITIEIDKETIGYWYNGEFQKYKEGRGATSNSTDITINNITGFSYYNIEEDKHQIILPISEKATATINIQPIKRFSGENGEKIYQREEIKEIINSIQIIKK